MKLDHEQQRAFIALACKVAWADGVVADEERDQVLRIVQRLGGTAVSSEELDHWLDSGAPDAELAQLSPELGEYFFYEAMNIVQSDGDVADEEVRALETIMARVFRAHAGTPLAKIALVKRPAR
ncbi:MAG: TerB family tellurite resistance protein [Deltaproteobacteria bacterium]|nr:TerB family tellurite resistance protein [Deltaproteobacteria bacterium]